MPQFSHHSVRSQDMKPVPLMLLTSSLWHFFIWDKCLIFLNSFNGPFPSLRVRGKSAMKIVFRTWHYIVGQAIWPVFNVPSAHETPHSATRSHGEAILQKDLMFQRYRNISSFYLTHLKTNPPILNYSNITGLFWTSLIGRAFSQRETVDLEKTEGEGCLETRGSSPRAFPPADLFLGLLNREAELKTVCRRLLRPQPATRSLHPLPISIIWLFICPVLLGRERTI